MSSVSPASAGQSGDINPAATEAFRPRRAVRLALAAAAVLAAGPIAADPPDRVRQRYPRDPFPTGIRYEFRLSFPQLDRPATIEDVENDRAVFTLVGLGERRVWRLPEAPMFAVRLPDRLPIGASDHGYAVQAEELLVGGAWKRYFGFVSKDGAAVVPGSELHLWYPDPDSEAGQYWSRLPGGLDWMAARPCEVPPCAGRGAAPLSLDKPIVIRAAVRNGLGAPRRAPGDLYRALGGGRHSFRRGVRLRLSYAPFAPENPSPRYPDDEAFTELSPAYAVHDPDPAKVDGALLDSGETADVGAPDLRELFTLRRPGVYLYWYEVDLRPAEGGNGAAGPGGSVRIQFEVGPRPRQLSIEEINAGIGLLGGPAVEHLLRETVHHGLEPPPPDTPGLPLLPDDFPVFTPDERHAPNGPPDSARFALVANANWESLKAVRAFAESGVRAEFERRMEAETASPPLRILYAAVAAAAHSRSGALAILEAMKKADYESVRNAQAALEHVLHGRDSPAPDWAVDFALAALTDDRYVTGLELTTFSRGTTLRISYLADEDSHLTWAVGHARAVRAVPTLIELVRKTDASRGPVSALGAIGDPRATPVLLDHLRRLLTAPTPDQWGRIEPLIHALGRLKAVEAVPLLLDHLDQSGAIEALANIQDARALPALRKLVADGGAVPGAPADESSPEARDRRWAAARLALATLEPGDPIPRWCALAEDRSLGEFDRREAVWRLRGRPDPRAVPVLARAIQSDPSGAVVNQSIEALGDFRCPEAVDALIAAFDADFTRKDDWKRAYEPAMFRDNIAASLRTLTGADLPPEKARWEAWWSEHRTGFRAVAR